MIRRLKPLLVKQSLQYRGNGTAVSLPRSIVGKRQCRFLRLDRSDEVVGINAKYSVSRVCLVGRDN